MSRNKDDNGLGDGVIEDTEPPIVFDAVIVPADDGGTVEPQFSVPEQTDKQQAEVAEDTVIVPPAPDNAGDAVVVPPAPESGDAVITPPPPPTGEPHATGIDVALDAALEAVIENLDRKSVV